MRKTVIQWVGGRWKDVGKPNGGGGNKVRGWERKPRKRQKEGGRGEVGRGRRRQKEPNRVCSKYEGCYGNYFLNGI